MRQPELNIKRARGFLLIVAILVFVVIAVAIAALANMTSADVRSSSAHAQSEQAYFAATSGIEYAAYQFKTGAGTNNAACTAITNATPAAVGSASFTLTGTYFNPANTSISIVGGITATDSVIPTPANGTLNFASHGRILIDGEQIVYRGKTSASFTGLRRGYAGTTATTHANAAAISQNQCMVRATGTSGSASRIIESALQPGPWSDYVDGGSVPVGVGASTLASIATTLPAGDNLIIAAVSFSATNTINVSAINGRGTPVTCSGTNGALTLQRGATVLATNCYPVLFGGIATISAQRRQNKTFFFVYKDIGAAANSTYSITAADANNLSPNGEAKILVISNAPNSVYAVGTFNSLGTIEQTVVQTGATTLPQGDNLVIAAVQIDNLKNNLQNVLANNLRLVRNPAGTNVTLDSNPYAIFLINNSPQDNEEYSHLLLAVDSNAAAASQYGVRATMGSNNSGQLEGKILVIQGLGAAISTGAALLTTSVADVGPALTTSFPAVRAGGGNVVIASTRYNVAVVAGGPFTTAATEEQIAYNSINRASNQFGFSNCDTGVSNACQHFPTALLWRQTAAPANPTFSLRSRSSTAASVNATAGVMAIHLAPVADRIEIFP